MRIELAGTPISKMRHRYYVKHGAIVTYNPQSDDDKSMRWRLEISLRDAINAKDSDAKLLSQCNAYKVDIEFHLPLPKNASKSQENQYLWYGDANIKPDIDNLVKFYLDAANGILWQDDKQIIELNVIKKYSQKPKTIINVIGIPTMTLHPNEQAILGIISPGEYKDLLYDLSQLFASNYESQELVLEDNSTDNRQHQLQRASASACFLSKIASKYGDQLIKIKKKYGEHWKDKEKNG